MSAPSVEISLLGRSFRVACGKDEERALLAAAAYLDGKMREIREQGKVIGIERIAIMAALNITHELLATDGGAERAAQRARVAELTRLMDAALAEQDTLF